MMIRTNLRRTASIFILLLLSGCTSIPTGVAPVADFSLPRYLGHWYEIARLDHRFERGLSQVTADYSLNDDGSVRVVNRGYDHDEQRWSTIEGVARFVSSDQSGHLKVSFFGPFYSSYVIFALDPQYQYAFVSGYSRDYLWLLSRTPEIPESVYAQFVQQAGALGFPVGSLIRVSQ